MYVMEVAIEVAFVSEFQPKALVQEKDPIRVVFNPFSEGKKRKEGIYFNTLLEITSSTSSHSRFIQPHGIYYIRFPTYYNESSLSSVSPTLRQGTILSTCHTPKTA